MIQFLSAFDNRETAIAIWLTALLAWGIAKPGVRRSIFNILRAAAAKQIVIGAAFGAAFFYLCVVALSALGVWTVSQLKLTVLWFLTGGLAGLFMIAQSPTEPRALLATVKRNLSISIVVDFFLNLYRLPLLGELVFVPFTAAVGAILAVAESEKRHEPVRKMANGILVIAGTGFLLYAMFMTVTHFGEVMTATNVRSLILPIMFSICMIPFFWAVMVYVAYENVFACLSLIIRDEALRSYAKWELAKRFRGNTIGLNRWLKRAWLDNPSSKDDVGWSISQITTGHSSV